MNISESANTDDNSNDSDEGYVFKLFPTGNNLYKQGSEVFNSYGKRNNDNLLTDYGFSILDNVITSNSSFKLDTDFSII